MGGVTDGEREIERDREKTDDVAFESNKKFKPALSASAYLFS